MTIFLTRVCLRGLRDLFTYFLWLSGSFPFSSFFSTFTLFSFTWLLLFLNMISDHAFIRFTLRVKKPIAEAHWTTSRTWRRLSRDAFASDLSASSLCSDLMSLDNSASADDLAKLYRDVMTKLLNKHCPMVKVCRKVKPMTPWFDADCRAARRCARSAERWFRRKRTAANKRSWAEKLKAMRVLYEDKNNNYWRTQISASKGDKQATVANTRWLSW